MAGPLNGIRVVEFGGIGPCPFAGMILADMGAEVIRIDRVTAETEYDPWSLPDSVLLRNRMRLALDLKHSQGLKIVRRLLEGCDVLLEGFRPGVMERLGLGPQACLDRNPGLVYGRVTGWGQDGPLAQAAGHDINYIALSGLLHAIGLRDRKPVLPLNLMGDFGAGGMLLAFGVLCALLERKTSGRGQVVDAAMVDGTALLMAMMYDLHGRGMWIDERQSNLLDGGAPFYDTYSCADGKHIAIGALEEPLFKQLCRLAGLEAEDFLPHLEPQNWPNIRSHFEALFKQRTRAEWCAILEGTDACFAPVLSLEESPQHQHNLARGTFIQRQGRMQPAPAPRFSRSAASDPDMAGGAGADTVAILRQLGLSSAQVEDLEAGGVIAVSV